MAVDMEAAQSRTLSTRPQIEKMRLVAGTVGLSYGVMLRGKLMPVENSDYLDLEKRSHLTNKPFSPSIQMTKGLVTSIRHARRRKTQISKPSSTIFCHHIIHPPETRGTPQGSAIGSRCNLARSHIKSGLVPKQTSFSRSKML